MIRSTLCVVAILCLSAAVANADIRPDPLPLPGNVSRMGLVLGGGAGLVAIVLAGVWVAGKFYAKPPTS